MAAKKHVEDRLAAARESRTRNVTIGVFEFRLKKWSVNQTTRNGKVLVEVIKQVTSSPNENALATFLRGDTNQLVDKYYDQAISILADTLYHNNFDTAEEAKIFIGEELENEDLVSLLVEVWKDNLRPLLDRLGLKINLPSLQDLMEPKTSTFAANSSPPDIPMEKSSTDTVEKNSENGMPQSSE